MTETSRGYCLIAPRNASRLYRAALSILAGGSVVFAVGIGRRIVGFRG